MFSGRMTQALLRGLDRLAPKAANEAPAHLRTGRRGEEDAYFYLRRRGYVMVARNFRTARHHGEIDLIGWDRGNDEGRISPFLVRKRRQDAARNSGLSSQPEWRPAAA